MVRSIIKGFGISLLSLCLGFAFLSNDNLIGRLKAAPNKSLSTNQTQVSELSASIFGSFEQEESKERDLSDDFIAHVANVQCKGNFEFIFLTSLAIKNRSYILQDLYLSLPPPV